MPFVYFLIALTLSSLSTAEAQRPQDPQRPYPYLEDRLEFDNPRAEGVRLAGTLTLPEGSGPFPAVVLVSGSGAQDRNQALAGHKPFLVLSDYLTRRGIAVLRYDDRGSFHSTGDFRAATSADLATDALAAVEYLATRPEIDPAQIGVVGHSEGGLIAPMVAVQSSAVAFIALLAGPGWTGEEILYAQQALILADLGANDAAIAFNRALSERYYVVLKAEPDSALAEAQLRQIVNDYLDGKIVPTELSDAEKEPILAELSSITEASRAEIIRVSFEPQLRNFLSPWWRYFLTYDPRPTLRQVQVPVLAINGDKDLQVPVENLAAIEEALRQGGNDDIRIVELPNLNHLFQTSETGSPSEYAELEETFSPVALDVIGNWLAAHTSQPTAVVAARAHETPAAFGLAQNYPNPFNGQTLIPFVLDKTSSVHLSIYNGLGQKVATLLDGVHQSGHYALHWDGRDESGRTLASGSYFYELKTLEWTQRRQLLLLQ